MSAAFPRSDAEPSRPPTRARIRTRWRDAVLASLAALTPSPALASPPPPSLPPGVAVSPPRGDPSPGGAEPGEALASDRDDNGQAFVVSDDRFHRVVTPAMQPVLAEMLPPGPGAFLPGGAAVAEVALRHEVIEVAIEVPGKGVVRYELRARVAPGPASEPGKFDVRRLPDAWGELPALRRALLDRLKQTEGPFEWTEVRAQVTFHRAVDDLARALAEVDRALALGDREAASREMMELVARHRPGQMEPVQAWQVAVHLRRAGRTQDAGRWFTSLVARAEEAQLAGPMPVALWQRHAGALRALGRADEAREAVKRCASRKGVPEWRCGLVQVAEAAALLGELDEAVASLDEAIGDGKGRPVSLLLERVRLLEDRGDVQGTLKAARAAAKLEPDDPAVAMALAAAENAAGDPEAALRRWFAICADQRAPPDVAIQGIDAALGHLREKTARLGDEAAWRGWQDDIAASAAAGHTAARFALALAAYHEGRFDEAVARLTPLAGTKRGAGRAALYLALAHHLAGRPAEARMRVQEARRADPTDAAVWCAVATVLYRPGAIAAEVTPTGQDDQREDRREAIDAQRRCLALSRRSGAGAKELEALQADLDAMLRGERRPGDPRDRTLFGRGGAPRPPLLAVAAVLLLGVCGGLWWWRRRRRRRGRGGEPTGAA